MLSRQHRFHGHTSLSYVYRRGTTVRNEQMALRFVRNPQRVEYRAAVIVSRKVHKSAVRRNRVRRRLYEIIRAQESITKPYDLVLTVFSEQIIDMPAEQLVRMVSQLLKKAHVLEMPAQKTAAQRDIVEIREEDR